MLPLLLTIAFDSPSQVELSAAKLVPRMQVLLLPVLLLAAIAAAHEAPSPKRERV